jgi:hypothetical protein
MKTLILLLSFLAFSATAETSIQIHGASYHVNDRTMNETNNGLGLRAGTDDLSLQVGFYKNSLSKTTI